MFMDKQRVLQQASMVLNRPDMPWVISVEGSSIVLRYRWDEPDFFDPTTIENIDELREFTFYFILGDNGQWKEKDQEVNKSKGVSFSGGVLSFGSSSNAFRGKTNQKSFSAGLGRKDDGSMGLVTAKFDTTPAKEYVRGWLMSCGWTKAGLFSSPPSQAAWSGQPSQPGQAQPGYQQPQQPAQGYQQPQQPAQGYQQPQQPEAAHQPPPQQSVPAPQQQPAQGFQFGQSSQAAYQSAQQSGPAQPPQRSGPYQGGPTQMDPQPGGAQPTWPTQPMTQPYGGQAGPPQRPGWAQAGPNAGPPPKKRRKGCLISVIIAVVFVIIFAVGVYEIMGSTVQQDFITLSNDKVPSVKYVLGETRLISTYSESNENDIKQVVITYNVLSKQNEEMFTYFDTLRSEWGFGALTDYDFSGPSASGFELGKDSVDNGFIIVVHIDYDKAGYTITYTRQEGSLTQDSPDTPDNDQPLPPPAESPSPSPSEDVPESQSLLAPFDSGEYYMKYKMTNGTGGSKVDVSAELWVSGDMIAVTMKTSGVKTRTIIRDGKAYVIIDSLKQVQEIDMASVGDTSIETADWNYTGSGTADFVGRELKYDEYKTDTGKTRVFIDNGELAGLATQAGGTWVNIQILKLTAGVDDRSVFDIPKY